MKTMLKSLLAASFVLVAAPAFAKGGKMAQNHKCMKDGAEVSGNLTKKACKKAGGKWEKGMPAAAGEMAPAPAPAPAGGTTP
jgi:hypothetical protein